MNWSRAKGILIVLFFLTNIVLGYQLLSNMRGVDGAAYVMGEDPEIPMSQKLEEVGITLDTDLPEEAPRLYRLRITPADADLEAMRSALFGTDPAEPVLAGGEVAGYRSEEGLLVAGSPGAVRYRAASGTSGGDISEKRARRVAEEFLQHPSLRPSGIVFDHAHPATEDDNVIVNYRQEYRGRPLFGGGVLLQVSSSGVREYQRQWFEVRGSVGSASQVLSASAGITANLARIGQIAPEDRLVEVLLGHYAGMSEESEWEVEPAWRLRFESGTVIIVNAFTGAVEWPL
ncbi:MAG: two-component system regulatory protein YycI [Clostridia bacterium]